MKNKLVREWPFYLAVLVLIFLIPQLFMAQPEYDIQVPGGVKADGPWTDLQVDSINILWSFVPLAVSLICLVHNLMIGKCSVPLIILIGLSLLSYGLHIRPDILHYHCFTFGIALSSQLLMLVPVERSEQMCLATVHFFTVSFVLMLQAYLSISYEHHTRGDFNFFFYLPMILIVSPLPVLKKEKFSKQGQAAAIGMFGICAVFSCICFLSAFWQVQLGIVLFSYVGFLGVESLFPRKEGIL